MDSWNVWVSFSFIQVYSLCRRQQTSLNGRALDSNEWTWKQICFFLLLLSLGYYMKSWSCRMCRQYTRWSAAPSFTTLSKCLLRMVIWIFKSFLLKGMLKVKVTSSMQALVGISMTRMLATRFRGRWLSFGYEEMCSLQEYIEKSACVTARGLGGQQLGHGEQGRMPNKGTPACRRGGGVGSWHRTRTRRGYEYQAAVAPGHCTFWISRRPKGPCIVGHKAARTWAFGQGLGGFGAGHGSHVHGHVDRGAAGTAAAAARARHRRRRRRCCCRRRCIQQRRRRAPLLWIGGGVHARRARPGPPAGDFFKRSALLWEPRSRTNLFAGGVHIRRACGWSSLSEPCLWMGAY